MSLTAERGADVEAVEEAGCSSAVEGSSQVVEEVERMQCEDDEEDMDETLSQLSDLSQEAGPDDPPSYSVKDINDFLDVTYGKRIVNVQDFFPDLDGFINSVKKLKKHAGTDQLSQKKRYRLSKLVGKVKKDRQGKGGSKL